MKSTNNSLSTHNHFVGAVWAAVRFAQTMRNNCFRVVRLPGQKRWSVVNRRITKQPAAFTIKSYRSYSQHKNACAAAGDAIKKWREALYREFTSTGSTKCIPRRVGNDTHEHLLVMAARKNNATAMTLLVQAGVNVNHAAGEPLRIAVHRKHHPSLLVLLKAGASVQVTRGLLYAPESYGTQRKWRGFLARLVTLIKNAKLDSSLPMFDDLVEIAQEPECRAAVLELAEHYPQLLARIL
jgi:hypothetical protein